MVSPRYQRIGGHQPRNRYRKVNNFFSNNNNMDKIISFLREKNRFKRLKKGVSVRHIIYAINSAKCLELKTFDFE